MTDNREIKTVLVCYTQAIFDELEPGAEPDEEPQLDDPVALARQIWQTGRQLVAALKAAGLTAEEAKVPQRSFVPRDVAKAAFGWRLLDITESNGVKIDMVVCLDFPAWSVSHPYKVCWLSSLPFFVTRRQGAPPPSIIIPGVISPNLIGPGNGNESNAQTVTSLLQAERRGLSEANRLLAGSREIAQEMARRGLQAEYNPIPTDAAASDPSGPEWQMSVKRLVSKYGNK